VSVVLSFSAAIDRWQLCYSIFHEAEIGHEATLGKSLLIRRSIQGLLHTGHSTGATDFPHPNFGCEAVAAKGVDSPPCIDPASAGHWHIYRHYPSGDKTMTLSGIVDLSAQQQYVEWLKKNAKRQAELTKAAQAQLKN
jgi:hypothetical protein